MSTVTVHARNELRFAQESSKLFIHSECGRVWGIFPLLSTVPHVNGIFWNSFQTEHFALNPEYSVTVLTVSTRLSLMLTAVLIFLSLSVYTGLRALDPTAESGRHRAHGHPHTAPGGGRPGPLFHGLSTGRRVEIQADSQTHAALYRTNHITHPLGAKTAHQNRTNYNSHPEQWQTTHPPTRQEQGGQQNNPQPTHLLDVHFPKE